jgi:hypothetical protein
MNTTNGVGLDGKRPRGRLPGFTNPNAGRPPGGTSYSNRQFIERCRIHSPRAVERLVQLMNQDDDRRLAYDAACAIIAHAHGKARERVTIEQQEATLTVQYPSFDELRQALIAEGLPIDRLDKPKLIEHGSIKR